MALRLPRHEIEAFDAARPTAPTATPTPNEPPANSVEIKQDELAARIAGCNLAFRALETDLDEKGEWTATRLEPLFERLRVLVVRRHDLQLFCEVLPTDQRSSVGQLASANGVVSQLAARVYEVRGRTSAAEFKGTDAERQAELRRLEALSRRLAEVAGK